CRPLGKGSRSFPEIHGGCFSLRNDTLIAHLHQNGAISPESKFTKWLSGLGKDWLRGLDLNQGGFGLRPSLAEPNTCS
ncbi:MAG: hypothetical protein O7E51_03590, partial [Acidobacteria bacterium]|nr:hypothetical protein [Acidobacteriota bacterium]